jgi:hypothetical protein
MFESELRSAEFYQVSYSNKYAALTEVNISRYIQSYIELSVKTKYPI